MNHETYPWALFAVFFSLGLVAMLLALPFPPRLSLVLPGLLVLVGVGGVGLLLANELSR
jgi:hypothetical protein